MNRKKMKGLILGLVFAMFLSNVTYAAGATSDKNFFDIATNLEEKAKVLNNYGILQGTSKGFQLDKNLTRAEGATIIVRLGGYKYYKYTYETDESNEYVYNYKFKDVPEWAHNSIGYLEKHGKLKGITETEFGSNKPMSAKDFLTMVLRVLEYDDNNGDFTWENSLDKAKELGIIDDEFCDKLNNEKNFTRGDMVEIVYNSLFTNIKDKDEDLIIYRANYKSFTYLMDFYGVEIDELEYNVLANQDPGLFKGDEARKAQLDEKILKIMKVPCEYYRANFKGETYKVNPYEILGVYALDGVSNGRDIFTAVKAEVIDTKGNKRDVLMNMLLKLENNSIKISSDRSARSDIGAAVIMSYWNDDLGLDPFDTDIFYLNGNAKNLVDENVKIECFNEIKGEHIIKYDNGAKIINILDK